jgi:diguanylate cyclase (GGDEF)-like protein
MYIDIDDFKAVNDSFGHREGDRALQSVASISGQTVRSIDILARMGGDEFVVLMPETGSREARKTAERLALALEDATLPDGTALTCSVGVVTYREPPGTVEDLLAGGDAAMYGAKSAGKNRVRHAIVKSEAGTLRR